MLKDLLYISKGLLDCLNSYDFSKDEIKYILNIVNKVIELSIIDINEEVI